MAKLIKKIFGITEFDFTMLTPTGMIPFNTKVNY